MVLIIQLSTSNEHKVMTLDNEMRGILEDKELSDIDKMNKYTEVMGKYLEYKDKLVYDKSVPLPRNDVGVVPKNVNISLGNDTNNTHMSDIQKESPNENIVTIDSNNDVVDNPPSKHIPNNAGKKLRQKIKLNDLIANWIYM